MPHEGDIFAKAPFDIREGLKHGGFAAVMGICGAAASIVLCLCTGFAYDIFQTHPWLVWGLPLFGIASLGLYKLLHLPLDMTTHDVMNRMRADEEVSPTLAPGILAGTCLTLLGGGSVGREAAALQMGASLGSLIGRAFHLKAFLRKRKAASMNGYAAAVGMAATFSALFFTPIGAAVFVVELARFTKNIREHFISILGACFIAYFAAKLFGIGDVIPSLALPEASWHLVGQCIVIGVAAALIGSLTTLGTDGLHRLSRRISKNCFVWVGLGGMLFACLVFFLGWTPLTGSGGELLNEALQGQYRPWDFAIKALLTIICLGLWFKGGEIMPSFCIGGLLGASCSIMTGGDPSIGAAFGAMAFFASFCGCPFGAFFMGCEIFGWGAAPWIALSVAIAYLTARSAGIYGAGLNDTVKHAWKRIRGSRGQLS